MSSTRWASKTYWTFVAVTIGNYVWQIPYYMHFYAVRGRSPAPFSIMFLVTFAWFAVAAFLLYRRRRGGFTTMVSFLALLTGFYILHNLSGAFLADLPLSDPILFIASVLGYLNTIVGIVLLVQLIRSRGDLVAGDPAATAGRGTGQVAAAAQPQQPVPTNRD
ncbi:hypothetical protein [Micromonospora sp. RTP1Z1]|uniref:hypothetical protein n=1 Tax=Micromonospora sp. RTP1Z1 TaxID=2994043 RepID=UPI0029C7FF6A|nr:hypothetical protein [Micromonospora sp. RTP1Z1]